MLERLAATFKTIAIGAGLRPLVQWARMAGPLAAFRLRNLFRAGYHDGRREVRAGGKVLVYDTFATPDNQYIVIVGHYGNLPPVGEFKCEFASGATSVGELIDDLLHETEGQQVLVVRFSVPELDQGAGQTEVHIWAGARRVVRHHAIVFNARRPRGRFAVTTLMKDEGRFLVEWIEYYRVIGADHFYIYDNRSASRTAIRRLLAPYIDCGQVTLLDWDYPYRSGAPDNSWRYCQRGQMHHCLYKYGGHTEWMLFVDVDEFIYPVADTRISILPLLEQMASDSSVAALQFKMMWFGDSGHERFPGGLVLEQYTRRDHQALEAGREKCIVQPRFTELMFIHAVKQSARGTQSQAVDAAEYRLNHYFATSAKRAHVRRPELNAVEDTGMSRFLALLRDRLTSASGR